MIRRLPRNPFPSASKAHREIEIKLKVCDARLVRRRLRELGFTLSVPRHLEQNVMFDFPDHRLQRSGSALRLRVARDQATLTLKESLRGKSRFKAREEIETAVGGAQEIRSILEKLGIVATARYSKRRTEYSVQKWRRGRAPVLVFDETAAGNFIELEGPPSWIDRIAASLGYSPEDYITTSYLELLHVAAPSLKRRRPRTLFDTPRKTV